MARKKRSTSKPRRRICVVTGTRAEFGLLVPVMDAIRKRKDLELVVIAAGAHFLKPARTIREVEAKYPVAARVPMQKQGKTGRAADAEALGRGVEGFARAFAKLKPDWVVVLGDRIEAFAAASAASIAGIAVCHIHGGDRAEGIADEAMRHAITKLSHLHCAATKLSADRIKKMGEKPEHVHVTGSPAIDGLGQFSLINFERLLDLPAPCGALLLHPAGLSEEHETRWARAALAAMDSTVPLGIYAFSPNHDPGSREILRVITKECRDEDSNVIHVQHMAREAFIGMLKHLARDSRGVLVGNSSAGLIEAAALGVPVVDLGPRQAGRERAGNIAHVDVPDTETIAAAIQRVISLRNRPRPPHPYGDGRAGPRIAALLAKTDPHAAALLRKRNSY